MNALSKDDSHSNLRGIKEQGVEEEDGTYQKERLKDAGFIPSHNPHDNVSLHSKEESKEEEENSRTGMLPQGTPKSSSGH